MLLLEQIGEPAKTNYVYSTPSKENSELKESALVIIPASHVDTIERENHSPSDNAWASMIRYNMSEGVKYPPVISWLTWSLYIQRRVYS